MSTRPLIEKLLKIVSIRRMLVPRDMLALEQVWVTYEEGPDFTRDYRFAVIRVNWRLKLERDAELTFDGRAYAAGRSDGFPDLRSRFWSHKSYYAVEPSDSEQQLHVRFIYERRYENREADRVGSGPSFGTADYCFTDLRTNPTLRGRFINELPGDLMLRPARNIVGFPLYPADPRKLKPINFNEAAKVALEKLKVKFNADLFIGRGLFRPLASAWFETFVKHTNEKELHNSAIRDFLKHAMDHNREFWEIIEPKEIIDTGCADGFLTESVVSSIPRMLRTKFKIDLFDTNIESLELANYRLEQNSFVCTSWPRNIFVSTPSFDKRYGCVICANVAYYAPLVEPFIFWMLNKLGPSSLGVFM